jgi:hypothetical protein
MLVELLCQCFQLPEIPVPDQLWRGHRPHQTESLHMMGLYHFGSPD